MKNKHDNDKHSYILTKETLGVTIMLFSAIVFVILLSFDAIFMGFGKAVCTFLYGTFGYGSYLLVALLAYVGEVLAFEKRIKVKPTMSLSIAATVLGLFLLFHAVTTRGYALDNYGSYLSQCYLNAANGYGGYSMGGVLSGLLVYPVAKLMTFAGAYVIFSLITVLFAVVGFIVIRNVFLTNLIEKAGAVSGRRHEADIADGQTDVQPQEEMLVDDRLYSVNENHEIISNVDGQQPMQTSQVENEDKFSRSNLGRQILFENGEFAAESYRRNMIYNENSYFNHPVHREGDYLRSFSDDKNSSANESVSSYTESYSNGVISDGAQNVSPSYVYGDKPVSDLSSSVKQAPCETYTVDRSAEPLPEENVEETSLRRDSVVFDEVQPVEELTDNTNNDYVPENLRTVEESKPEPVAPASEEVYSPRQIVEPEQKSEEAEEPTERRRGINLFDIFNSSNPNLTMGDDAVEPDTSRLSDSSRGRSREQLFDDIEGEDGLFGNAATLSENNEQPVTRFDGGERRVGFAETPVSRQPSPQAQPQPKIEEVKPAEVRQEEQPKPKHVWKKYVRPTLDLLDDYPENNNVNTGEIEDSKRIICETLAHSKIESRVANVVVGPAITRYDVIIEDRTNIKNALGCRDQIALALMKENVNAYLNYAKGAISIEVPNGKRAVVGLKGMLASSEFINAKKDGLAFTLGKNVDGQVVCPDITKMPHLLVAGTTGSGKSICLSTLIVSLLYKYGPEELRFILVDPKQVEFISYDKLPHLMINEIIYDADKALKALNWAIKEMERRYAIFKEMTQNGIATKNLNEYNAHLPEGEEKLPKIVIILDEFGDLMLQAKKEIESRIVRLVQKARACGIHLILATQRPSVDCITGLIKSNLPTRIGFKVNSIDDSKCIFDRGGAEKLLGKGDLYLRSTENPDLARIQGCFIDTPEVQRVTDYIKEHNETYFDEDVSDFINKVEEAPAETSSDDSVIGESSKVDDTFIKALWFCVTSNQASVSMIQRRFPIGYMKACKIIDWMENMNYITQSEGSKPRKVLLSKDEFIQKYGEVDD